MERLRVNKKDSRAIRVSKVFSMMKGEVDWSRWCVCLIGLISVYWLRHGQTIDFDLCCYCLIEIEIESNPSPFESRW